MRDVSSARSFLLNEFPAAGFQVRDEGIGLDTSRAGASQEHLPGLFPRNLANTGKRPPAGALLHEFIYVLLHFTLTVNESDAYLLALII